MQWLHESNAAARRTSSLGDDISAQSHLDAAELLIASADVEENDGVLSGGGPVHQVASEPLAAARERTRED